ncbi:MAG: hypothetical protein Q9160_002158 [Pyrenula sp. 1 TL-2023]
MRYSSLPAAVGLSSVLISGAIAQITTVTVSAPASECSQSSPTGTGTGATPSATKELNDYALEAGKLYFGTASDIPPVDDQGAELYDQAYMALLNDSHMFGQRTPANIQKWMFTEPSPGEFNFTGGDQFISWAQEHNQLVRCHNLNWYNQLPDWLANGNWTNATLTAVLEREITAQITHYGDACYAWDVVNEAFTDDATTSIYRDDLWSQVIGAPAYIYLSFQFAQAAVEANNLNTKLYYNDYNIESPNNKSANVANLVSELQARNIRIDGVGLQSHFVVGGTPSRAQQLQTMNSYIAYGVEVAQTELDVRFSSLPYNASGLQTQKENYRDSVGACVDAGDACVGTTLWDFDDAYSWVPGTFEGEGAADVWDESARRKPAYYGVVEGLTGEVVPDPPGTVSGPGTVTRKRGWKGRGVGRGVRRG